MVQSKVAAFEVTWNRIEVSARNPNSLRGCLFVDISIGLLGRGPDRHRVNLELSSPQFAFFAVRFLPRLLRPVSMFGIRVDRQRPGRTF